LPEDTGFVKGPQFFKAAAGRQEGLLKASEMGLRSLW